MNSDLSTFIENFDFMLVIFTSLVILFLGFVAFLNSQSSETNKTFLLFSVFATLYGISNYLYYTLDEPQKIIWASRFVGFFVIWYSFYLYKFFYVFPHKEKVFGKKHKTLLLPLVVFTSILCLTPFVFADVNLPSDGGVPIPVFGWGGVFFAGLSGFLTVGGIYLLFKKFRKAKAQYKKRYWLILIGTLVTYTLYIVFSLIFTVVFSITNYVPLAPVFILPFIILTFYSIVRYKFLNVKIIATESITLVLVILALVDVFTANGLGTTIYKVIVFSFVTTLGGLLIRSVRKEVKQRERLSVLSEELAQKTEMLEDLRNG